MPDDPGTLQALRGTLMEVAKDMVPTVFTAERLARLMADLKAYRRKLSDAREKEALLYAHVAHGMLESEDTLVPKPFLAGICHASLRLALTSVAEQAGEVRPEPGAADAEG